MNEEKKNQLIESIKTADGLTDDQRSFLLELLREKKPYGLVWENKKEDVEERLRDYLPVLVEDRDKALTNGGSDAPNHVLIEGDNLEALTTLAYTHAGKIDVIYIDPPYNTGNKDFVYYDDFSDEYRTLPYVEREDSYRHSKWLSFMFKRLSIAKKLLSDQGIIFISIDDNEQANLKLLCDEIFGENNFKSNSIVINNRGGRDYGGIALQHDYILIYTKAEGQLQLINEPDKEFKYKDEIGGFNLMELRNRNVKFNIDNRPNLCYPFYVNPYNVDKNGLMELSLEPKDGFIEVYPAKSNGVQTVWRWGKEEKARKNLNIEIFGKANRNGGFMIVQKYRKTTRMQRSIWDDKEFVNERGSEVLKEILTQNIFSYPKSVATIRRVLELGCCSRNSIILDFFAGSGTTLHAVMQLNAEDGGHRRCIMITNNENGICEKVTYERSKCVINGYSKTTNGEHVDGLNKNKLRYYKTQLLEKDNNHSNRRALFAALTDVLCLKENIYHEVFQFGDLNLSGKGKMLRYFAENGRQMLIIYDSRVIKFIVNEISKQDKTETPIKIFIYADGMYPYTEDFKGVLDRIELIPMPYAFTHAIKGCIPEAEDKRVDQTELSQQEQDNLLIEAAEAENQDN